MDSMKNMLLVLTLSMSILMIQSNASTTFQPIIVNSSSVEGAVCLDGSPPGYYFSGGKDEGKKNWIVYLEGGAWCSNNSIGDTNISYVDDCTHRSRGGLGTSKFMFTKPYTVSGFLDNDPKLNFFHDWNRAVIHYCDGASFAGDADQPDPVTKLYYRGSRIFRSVVNELMVQGLRDADNIILAGGSAGGVGVMVHCDRFRSLFPITVRVKCYADGSFFLHVKDPKQAQFFETVFGTVADMQQISKSLPAECTAIMSPALCLFPQHLIHFITTPIYLYNSAFDAYQVLNTISKDLAFAVKNHTVDPIGMITLQDFRQQMISALPLPCPEKVYLITSKYGHSFADNVGYKTPLFPYLTSSNVTVENVLIDWFFDRRPVDIIDPSLVPF